MDNQQEVVQNLKDMGFEDAIINQALKATNSTNIEVLITYLENFQNNPDQEQAPQENLEQPPKGASISGMVNQEYVAILISLGHSKNVSEKALLMSGNKSVEAAQAWIEEHKNDADFEEELTMVGQEQKQVLSPEEAQQKARELQQQIREKRKKEEEQMELERERNRIQGGKQMTQAKREMEELQRRQDAERQKKQRIQDQKDKEAMLEQLRRDKEARFGKQFGGTSSGQSQPSQQQQKNYTKIELFEVGVKQIKVAQPPDLLPDVAKNSLSLIVKILSNIISNPSEQKFRKISLTSNVFKTKIDEVFGAKNALDGLGFIEEDGFYIYKFEDMNSLQQAIQLTQKELVGL